MIMMLAAWAFGSFIYFKVAFDALFYESISIIAALLLALTLSAILFWTSGIYAMRLLKYNWSPGMVPASLATLIGKTILPLLGMSIVFVVIARLIIFGFSKQLHKEIDLYDFRGNISEAVIAFVVIVVAPLLLHYVMSVLGTYVSANRGSASREP